MLVYEKSSCGKCGVTIDGWDVASRGLGRPFIVCKLCGTANDRSEKINGWDLCDTSQRISFFLIDIYWCFGTSIVLSMGVAFLVFQIWSYLESISVTSIDVLQIWVIGQLLSIFLFVLLYLRGIKKSRKRMRDPVYRKALYNLVS